MAVRIRMKRLGRRHRPFFRICAMDVRTPRDGRAIEELGYYDPMVRDKSQRVKLDMDRVDHWLSVGAQPSEKVAVLIKKVKENRWGEPAAPPPMAAPKAPQPEKAGQSGGEGGEGSASEGEGEQAAQSEGEAGDEVKAASEEGGGS